MAIGLARLFGVKLPANFNSPYKSTSIIDFWRRWHMTLSRFLRDYLYVPLGGNRKGPVRRYVNSDADHAARRPVARGGLDLCGLGRPARLLSAREPSLGAASRASGARPRSRWAITLLAVIAAWVFFRASDFCERREHARRNDRIARQGRSHYRRRARATGIVPPRLPAGDRDPAQLAADHAALRAGHRAGRGPARAFCAISSGRLRGLTAALGALAIIAVVLFSWGTTEFLYFQF